MLIRVPGIALLNARELFGCHCVPVLGTVCPALIDFAAMEVAHQLHAQTSRAYWPDALIPCLLRAAFDPALWHYVSALRSSLKTV